MAKYTLALNTQPTPFTQSMMPSKTRNGHGCKPYFMDTTRAEVVFLPTGMDITTNHLSPEIVTANDASFGGRQRTHYHSVESRMCLWCKSGRGDLVVNGERLQVRPSDYFVLPWRHSIRYEPDTEAPFFLAGIHLIPWHDPTIDVTWGVAHDSTHPLYGVSWRQDRLVEGAEQVVRRHLSRGHRLLHLSEYIVQRATRSHRERESMQSCAQLLLDELRGTLQEAPPRPRQIEQLEAFIEQHIARPLGVRDLATALERSPSQIARLCREHLHLTPGHWIARIKIATSCDLLRTTRLSISDVARRIGYDDQFHFSRVFKRQMGLSPLKYRQQQPLL
jgi:AraC family transcriptional regulator, arabinose operon regulatory protein